MDPEARGNIYRANQVKEKIWNLLVAITASMPRSLRKLQCRLLFAAAAKSCDADGLWELFSSQDDLMHELEQAAIRYEGGIHPKHRVTDYHRFFVERIRAGEKVLDIGCGNGSVAFSMAEAGAIVTGIDINEPLIQSARRRYERANLIFIAGDVTKALPSGCFDVVVLSNVLEHIDNRQQFLMTVCEKARLKRFLSETPRGEPRGILAQLDLKLRRPMRDVFMIFYVPLYYGTSHTVSDCPCKVSIFPQLPAPQLLLQRWKLAEQHPGTLTLDYSYYLPYRSARGKGY
jgi:SAM-dependent methyltransferase